MLIFRYTRETINNLTVWLRDAFLVMEADTAPVLKSLSQLITFGNTSEPTIMGRLGGTCMPIHHTDKSRISAPKIMSTNTKLHKPGQLITTRTNMKRTSGGNKLDRRLPRLPKKNKSDEEPMLAKS